MVWGRPGTYQGTVLCVFDLTVGRPWDASVSDVLKATLRLQFSSNRFRFYPLVLPRGREGLEWVTLGWLLLLLFSSLPL